MKKTMRKSALLSSVAMLIVSAIVLTSATYAWFSASQTVSVEGINGSIQATTGLLIRKGTSGDWKTSINLGEDSPSTFVPVSTANGTAWVTGTYENNALKTTAITTTDSVSAKASGLLRVDFQVKGPIGAEVDVAPDFSGTSDNAKRVTRYAIVKKSELFTSNVRCFDNSVDPYNGTSDISAGIAGPTGDAYVVAGTQITPTNDNYSFTLADENPVDFTLWVWVEGNDEDCIANDLKSADVALNLTFTHTNAA